MGGSSTSWVGAARNGGAVWKIVCGALSMQEYMGGGTLKSKVSKQMLRPNSVVYTNKQVCLTARAVRVLQYRASQFLHKQLASNHQLQSKKK